MVVLFSVINFVGMKIFHYEVEAVINQFPGVKESYVYGENHPKYGQLTMAKIILQDGINRLPIDNLSRFCYQKPVQ